MPLGMALFAPPFYLILSFLAYSVTDILGLSDVSLHVSPPAIESGEDVILECHYDLDNLPLYSVKFYRGYKEIFRFSPREIPQKKKFFFHGINVDTDQSNASQVYLRSVDYSLGGNVSCEVTTDRVFKTAVAFNILEVVVLPKNAPVISLDKQHFSPGERIRATCSYEPSLPKARLRLFINNQELRYDPWNSEVLNRTAENAVLALDFFTPVDFSDDYTDVLDVRCDAHVGNFFRQESHLRITAINRDPVPERVRSSAGYCSHLLTSSYILGMLICVLKLLIIL